MQLDENDPGSVAARPAARADGVALRWFANRDTGGGVAGTVIDQDHKNDLLGNIRFLLTKAAVTRQKGAANDSDLADAIAKIAQMESASAGHIHGFRHQNAVADSAHDITVEAGGAVSKCRDSTDSVTLTFTGPRTKQIDAAWAAGDNAGGFPSALSLAADTWYRFFLIAMPDGTVDFGWDTSSSAANLLSDATGYTLYRQIGWHLTDATSNLEQYIQDADNSERIYWLAAVGDAVSVVPTTTATNYTLSAPPDAIAMFCASWDSGLETLVGVYALFTATSQTDVAPSVSQFNVTGFRQPASARTGQNLQIKVNGSSQLRTRFSQAGASLSISTYGYIYTRGAL